MTPRLAPRPPARGAALLVAMVLLTLVATLAAGMVWQQWRAVQVEIAERGRAQLAWILSGAADWARLILREDLRADNQRGQLVDHLNEPTRCFALFCEGRVLHVSKRHVSFMEELA